MKNITGFASNDTKTNGVFDSGTELTNAYLCELPSCPFKPQKGKIHSKPITSLNKVFLCPLKTFAWGKFYSFFGLSSNRCRGTRLDPETCNSKKKKSITAWYAWNAIKT